MSETHCGQSGDLLNKTRSLQVYFFVDISNLLWLLLFLNQQNERTMKNADAVEPSMTTRIMLALALVGTGKVEKGWESTVNFTPENLKQTVYYKSKDSNFTATTPPYSFLTGMTLLKMYSGTNHKSIYLQTDPTLMDNSYLELSTRTA